MLRATLLCFLSALSAHAQWKSLPSPVKTDLLTVDVRDAAVWAAGKDGVVIHSIDHGQSWQSCTAVAKDGSLSLSSIAALDTSTAVVMRSGKGEASKVYRTIDSCKTWQVVFENPEQNSSFYALRRVTGQQIYLLAEPVAGKFAMYFSQDGGAKWFVTDDAGLDASPGESATSALVAWGPFLYFGTQSSSGPRIHFTQAKCPESSQADSCPVAWSTSTLSSDTGAVTAISFRFSSDQQGRSTLSVAAMTSGENGAKAALSSDGGKHWIPATLPATMHAASSAFDPAKQMWIAAGPEGTVLSLDLGKHWVQGAEAGSEADSGWQAIALPFAVGNGGRVGMLSDAKTR